MNLKTQEELLAIKTEIASKNKKFYTFEVLLEDEETIATFYFKQPGRMEMSAISKMAASQDPHKATDTFINTCYLGGDDKNILFEEDNFDMFRQVEKGMFKVDEVKEMQIKKN